MSHQTINFAALRFSEVNPNHHLWSNHGTWFIHYMAYPTRDTKLRVRRSLGTKSLVTARSLRDEFFDHQARLSGEQVITNRQAVA